MPQKALGTLQCPIVIITVHVAPSTWGHPKADSWQRRRKNVTSRSEAIWHGLRSGLIRLAGCQALDVSAMRGHLVQDCGEIVREAFLVEKEYLSIVDDIL